MAYPSRPNLILLRKDTMQFIERVFFHIVSKNFIPAKSADKIGSDGGATGLREKRLTARCARFTPAGRCVTGTSQRKHHTARPRGMVYIEKTTGG